MGLLILLTYRVALQAAVVVATAVISLVSVVPETGRSDDEEGGFAFPFPVHGSTMDANGVPDDFYYIQSAHGAGSVPVPPPENPAPTADMHPTTQGDTSHRDPPLHVDNPSNNTALTNAPGARPVHVLQLAAPGPFPPAPPALPVPADDMQPITQSGSSNGLNGDSLNDTSSITTLGTDVHQYNHDLAHWDTSNNTQPLTNGPEAFSLPGTQASARTPGPAHASLPPPGDRVHENNHAATTQQLHGGILNNTTPLTNESDARSVLVRQAPASDQGPSPAPLPPPSDDMNRTNQAGTTLPGQQLHGDTTNNTTLSTNEPEAPSVPVIQVPASDPGPAPASLHQLTSDVHQTNQTDTTDVRLLGDTPENASPFINPSHCRKRRSRRKESRERVRPGVYERAPLVPGLQERHPVSHGEDNDLADSSLVVPSTGTPPAYTSSDRGATSLPIVHGFASSASSTGPSEGPPGNIITPMPQEPMGRHRRCPTVPSWMYVPDLTDWVRDIATYEGPSRQRCIRTTVEAARRERLQNTRSCSLVKIFTYFVAPPGGVRSRTEGRGDDIGPVDETPASANEQLQCPVLAAIVNQSAPLAGTNESIWPSVAEAPTSENEEEGQRLFALLVDGLLDAMGNVNLPQFVQWLNTFPAGRPADIVIDYIEQRLFPRSVSPSHNSNSAMAPYMPLSTMMLVDPRIDLRGPADKCIICMATFRMGDRVTTLPCLHYYHQECFERWFMEKRICPLCSRFCH